MSRKLLLIAVISGLFCQLNYAQKWVSTSPQKKIVVLEEFTGIHCGYCPDGHKKGNDLAVANPGKVILINIHSGSFAVPQAGEPDFRITEGETIDDAAGVTGYPSGSVNRSTSPWGQSRSNWANLASTILSQNSPVNVAVKASIDHITRKLTVEVEGYYTANSPQTKNYLTVMLLQNNELGPQSDYGNYNPTNWVSGKYVHNHILRQLITPAMGESIDTTTSGYYFYKKYESTLPSIIKNVDLLFYNLEVVAFVHETTANIYSGALTHVEFDENIKTDLGMEDITVFPSDMCFTSINPKIKVTNNMNAPISSFEVTANIDGTPYAKTFNGALNKGENTIIDWGSIAYSAKGSFSININGFKNVNGGGLYDIDLMNDFSTKTGIGFTSKAFSTINATFENVMPLNLALDKSDNSSFGMIYSTTTSYGAKTTRGAIRFPLHSSWNLQGKAGKIVFGEAELSKLSNPFLSFYYAYSDDNYGGTKPEIKVEISENCGATWQTIRTIVCNETGKPATSGNWYVPKSSEYIWVGVPLADYKTKNILIRVSGIAGTAGNALYIDDLKLADATSVAENKDEISLNLYPNPVKNAFQVDVLVPVANPVKMSIYNMLGEEVLFMDYGVVQSGYNTFNANLNQADKGIYIMKLQVGDNTISRKFQVE